MSTAEKHDDKQSLPPVPNLALFSLSRLQPTTDLPPAPPVKIVRKNRPRNLFLIAMTLFVAFIAIACFSAGTIYMIVNGTIEIEPGKIKSFLRALSFK